MQRSIRTLSDITIKPAGNVRDYGAKGDGVTDDSDAIIQTQLENYRVIVPECNTGALGYRTTKWIPVLSHRHWEGVGQESTVYNDKTNVTVDKRACLLPGNHHPALMSGQTSYALNAIAYGDPGATFVTSGDAANFTAGQLVIVGSNTNISGVSRHAQLNKVDHVAAPNIYFVDPIEADISDARIWTISGTDGTTSTPIYAVEDILIEKLGFRGRSAFATKDAVFRGTFRDLWMLDVHIFFALNMGTHVVAERFHGQYSGRYIETAFNSYDVTCRGFRGRFRPPSGLQAGETMVLPIHLGEQPYRILLDDVECHVDSRFTPVSELIQVKGSKIKFHKCDFRHAGSAGSFLANIPDNSYTGFHHDHIVFDESTLAAPGKARIALVGGATVAAENPQDVHFRGGEMLGTVTSESIWFQGGKGFSCSMRDRTGKAIKVGTAARYPNLNGYKRG
jgi:hypothetical protein